MRALLIRPSFADPDVEAHARSLAATPDLKFSERAAPKEEQISSVFRVAAELFRNRAANDVVIAAGPNALAAAAIGWRGPIVHLPLGRLTQGEISIGRRLARRGNFNLVTTSPSLARQALQTVADARCIRVVRPSPAVSQLGRRAARERLGVGDQQTLVYVPGMARHGSNHRLGLWAANILYFRDTSVRVLLRGGGPRDGFVRRFVTSAEMWPAVVTDDLLNDADCAAAADVAICAADGVPDVSPLAALHRAGTPIVGLRSTWLRERLPFAATLVNEAKARRVARAALDAMDAGRSPDREDTDPPVERAWHEILAALDTAKIAHA